ncbi:MAG TPA: hypothetical protein VH643_12975 [Gemmataceae bacterium]|jgi:hypothetical protein
MPLPLAAVFEHLPDPRRQTRNKRHRLNYPEDSLVELVCHRP